MSWVSIQSTHAALRRSIHRSYPQAIELAVERQRAWLHGGREEIGRLAARGDWGLPASGGRRTQERDPATRSAALARALQESEHFAGLALLPPEGSLAASAGELPDGVRCAPAGAPPSARPELYASSPPEAASQALAVAPLGSPGGRRGCLLGVFRPGGFATQLERGRPGPEAQLVVRDARGFAVAHSRPAADSGGSAPEPVPPSQLSQDVAEYTSAAGVHVIGAAAPLGELGWSVSIEAPFDAAFQPLLSATALILGIDLCVILGFSCFAYRRAAALVKPIELLCDGAQRIAAGQMDIELPAVNRRDEIGLLARAFHDMLARLRREHAQLQANHRHLLDHNQDLRQANEVLSQLSITDGLTKLHNHRFFQDHLTREIKRVNRVDEPLSILLVDIDDFKALNDRFGHAAGDELLLGIARIMDANVRESDLLARYGGEEFVVLAPDTDRDGAFYLAEKIRTAIAESSFILGESMRPTRLTVSVGVAQYAGNRKAFFLNADRALYDAKAQGKNCVVAHEEEQA